jgi:hypothetical protein
LTALSGAIRARDPSFQLLHARIAPLASHHHALELVGIETISGQQREVRTTHFFIAHQEVVIDEFVPPNQFPSIDHNAFLPVVYSLRVGSAAAQGH